MSEPDLVSRYVSARSSLFQSLISSPHPLGSWVLVAVGVRDFVLIPTAEVEVNDPTFPAQHRPAVAIELGKPRGEDELLLIDVTAGDFAVARIDRAQIAREAGPPLRLDPRNHFPMPWPMGWRGPYALDVRDTYRLDAPGCQVLARIDESWDYGQVDEEMSPKHLWNIEIGVTRSLDSALADDDQVESITARFRNCGPWVETTHLHQRRHPSRRIFTAEVEALPEGSSPWPEVQPQEPMFGPPPGWEPVGSFRDRPLVLRIEGTRLHLEWVPPPGASWFEAATGRVSEASRFTISATGGKPTDDEVGIVFATLGGAAYREVKGVRPPGSARAGKKGEGNARVFLATAGWLRKPAGNA